MAAITTRLDTRHMDAKGNYAVKIVITNLKTASYISMGFSLPESAWIKNGLQRPVKNSFKASKMYNDRIEDE